MERSLEDFTTRLQSLKGFWEIRKTTLVNLEKAETLQNYLDGLKAFSEAFPNDSLNHEIKKIQAMLPLYDDLMSDPESYNSGSRFWYAAAERMKAFEEHMAQHREELIKAFQKVEDIHAFVNLWECVVKKPNEQSETWYFMGEPALTFEDGVKSYAGGAYVPFAEDLYPLFSPKFVIPVHVQDLKKSPHCDYVQQMITRIIDDLSMETILKEIRQLGRQPFFPILKLDLLRYLVKPLATLAGKENAQEFADVADLLEKSNLKYHWLCTANPKYETESKNAAAVFNDILIQSDIIHRYMLKLKIESIALKRLPQWVGFVDLEESKKLHLKFGTEANEIWVLRNGDLPRIFVVREMLKGRILTRFDNNRYMPGEPLFAPAGSQTTWEVLHSMFIDLQLTGDVNVEWPLAWPVNVREDASGL